MKTGVISGLFFLFYLALGASIFSAIESPIEKAAMEELQKRKADFLQSHSCITGNAKFHEGTENDDAYWRVRRPLRDIIFFCQSHAHSVCVR